jgi:hypothetical protein
MIKRIAILAILLSLITTCLSQKPRANVGGAHLLKTAWGGSPPFNAFAPNGSTLGCHANAFAQVMYFHRLAPHGKVSYKCKNGTSISEDFSDYKPHWNAFALNKDAAKEDVSATRETSRLIYYVASVVRKDFGTDQYVDYPNDYHKKAMESHFHCTLTPYPKEVQSSIGHTLRAKTDSYALMKAEIDSGRPAGFYYTDRKGGGHAVVIDGYTVEHGKTYFHVNFGWFGRSDGWYLLEEDLPKNSKEIAVITIVPKRIKRTKNKETEQD